jgi:hypothetical protein
MLFEEEFQAEEAVDVVGVHKSPNRPTQLQTH